AVNLQDVFRNYHKAVLATNLDDVLKWSVKSRSDAFAKASAAERNEAMAFTVKSTPKTYKVTGSIIEPNGRDATLYLSADVTDKGKTEPLYGSVVFEKEGSTWKVAAAGWSRIQSPAAARQGTAAAAEPAPPSTPAARLAPTAPVAQPKPARSRSEAATTKPAAPTLQQSTPPCVYKPVMTDEEIARCR
ncbi:MAG: hypothetical protein OEX21_06195, partial [Betaproteobacteria bacterium]|nr:hypothetical protein [Betaproteobacteria bacterium]